MEKPTAAARNPLMVWSMVSQLGTSDIEGVDLTQNLRRER